MTDQLENAFIGVHRGVADNVAPELLPSGYALKADNCWYTAEGKLRKRYGHVNLLPGGPVSLEQAWAMGSYKQHPIWLSTTARDNPIYEWLPGTNVMGTAYSGIGDADDRPLRSTAKANIRAKRQTVASGDVDYVGVPTTAYAEGLTCIAYESSSTSALFRVVIIDQATGSVIANNQYTGSTPKVMALKNGSNWSFCVLYADFTVTTLKLLRWAVTGNTWTTSDATAGPTSLDTNFTDAGQRNWDAIRAYGSETTAYVAWQKKSSATTTVQCASYTVSGGLGTPVDVSAEADQCMGWLHDKGGSGERLLAVAGSTNGVLVKVMDSAFSVDSTQTADASDTANVRNLTGFTTSNNSAGYHKLLWEVADTTNSYDDKIRFYEYSASPTSADDWILSANLQSKIFWITDPGGTELAFFLFGYDSAIQGTTFVGWIDHTNEVNPQVREPQCKIFPFSGGEATTKTCGIASPALIDDDSLGFTVVAGLRRKARLDYEAATLDTDPSLERMTFNFHPTAEVGAPKEIGDWLIVPGGSTRFFDGRQYGPWPFDLRPEVPTLTPGTVGNLTGSSTYRYQAVYKFVDAQGRVHRSAPSLEASTELSASQDSVSVDIPTLRIGPDDGSIGRAVTVELYRTEADLTLKHLVGTVANNPDADTVNIVDLISDTDLATGELLYSDGQLANVAPPGFSDVVNWQGHIVGIEAETPTAIWISKAITLGKAPGFSEDLVIDLPDTEDATALAVLDDQLYVITKKSVFVALGSPQDDTGGGQVPILRQVGQRGTDYPRSVLVYDGIWFSSDDEIWKINRGLQTESHDRSSLGSGTPIGAVYVHALSQLRWYFDDGTYSIYSTDYDAWTECDCSETPKAVAMYNERPIFANLTGSTSELWREKISTDSSPYLDDAANVIMTVQFPWFAVNQRQGEIRVHRILPVIEYMDDCVVRTNVYHDFDDANSIENAELDISDLSLSAGDPVDIELQPSQFECHAFSMSLYDSFSGSATEGFRLVGIMIVYAVTNQFRNLPDANKMTQV